MLNVKKFATLLFNNSKAYLSIITFKNENKKQDRKNVSTNKICIKESDDDHCNSRNHINIGSTITQLNLSDGKCLNEQNRFGMVVVCMHVGRSHTL